MRDVILLALGMACWFSPGGGGGWMLCCVSLPVCIEISSLVVLTFILCTKDNKIEAFFQKKIISQDFKCAMC
jgi:hypothetical protein